MTYKIRRKDGKSGLLVGEKKKQREGGKERGRMNGEGGRRGGELEGEGEEVERKGRL